MEGKELTSLFSFVFMILNIRVFFSRLEILKKWIETHGTWNLMKPSIEAVLKHYNKDMVEFGLFGFCWGGNTSLEVGTELTKSVKAVAIVHPFLVETEQASNRINTPVLVLPSQDEPDYVSLSKLLEFQLYCNLFTF